MRGCAVCETVWDLCVGADGWVSRTWEQSARICKGRVVIRNAYEENGYAAVKTEGVRTFWPLWSTVPFFLFLFFSLLRFSLPIVLRDCVLVFERLIATDQKGSFLYSSTRRKVNFPNLIFPLLEIEVLHILKVPR